jgi:dTDP-4-dehydrorhamnose reductase
LDDPLSAISDMQGTTGGLMKGYPLNHIDLWGGIECTINRVGDTFFDQLVMSGHDERIDDLGRIANLGLRTLRYPANWERIERNGVCDWNWQDARMERLAALGIEPVLHLLHHGSGPLETSPLDSDFPERFARFAGQVAERYPWVTSFVPINEPVTTARFSTLYGFWYPHLRDTNAFFRAVWNQCRAIQLGMQAIRRVTPGAICILTDDYGRTHSTPSLRYQADFDNTRRWIALDLLFGRVTPEHPLWPFLRHAGISTRSLLEMVASPLEHTVVGVDYYLTSERFLDHRLARYPAWTHGGNGRDAYADIEAVRVRAEGIDGVGCLLTELWQRYRRPIAVTEAFLGAPTNDQIRWLQTISDAAHAALIRGVPVQSITCWSLLGSYEWDSLVTRRSGTYEPGAFDLATPDRSETSIATWIRATASGHAPPATSPGWWETGGRLLYQPVTTDDAARTSLDRRYDFVTSR